MDKIKKRPIIAIDIDDVLSDNAAWFIDYCNKHWGRSLTINDYDEHWQKVLQVDDEQLDRMGKEYYGSDYISKYNCIPDSVDALNKLKTDYELLIITSRPNYTRQRTVSWIQNKYPGIFAEDHIIFAGFWDIVSEESIKCTKGELSKKLGAGYIIDDQLKHCIGASEHGVKGILFGNYNWNQASGLPVNVQRAKSWVEVLDYFYGQQEH